MRILPPFSSCTCIMIRLFTCVQLDKELFLLETCGIKTPHAEKKTTRYCTYPSSCTHGLQSKESEEGKKGERMDAKTMCGTGEIVAKIVLLFQNFEFPY
jgi:hypothetical protein